MEQEDSSQLFMQWALCTLQHDELPPATPAATAYDGDNGCNAAAFSSIPALGYSALSVNSMVPGEPPAREGQRAAATNSWSSADTDGGDGGGTASVTVAQRDAWSPSSQQNSVNQQVSWDFSSASAVQAQLVKEAQANSAAGGGGGVPVPVPQPQMVQRGSPATRRRASAKMPAASSSAPCSQDHIVAERKRREKINQRFIELSAVIPCLKKMDKATILSDATRYVKELQEKLKALQQQQEHGSGNARGGMESAPAVLIKKPRIAAPPGDDDDRGGGPSATAGAAAAAAATRNDALPEIEARISDDNVVMLRICCKDGKGVLVRLLAEVEELCLSITHSNAMPFSASILVINIMAKVSEGFNTTADAIVGRLHAVLAAGPEVCVRD